MKKTLRNLPFVAKPIETIDFKTFCEGGSPEYVAAKKKLKNLYLKHQSFSAANGRNSTPQNCGVGKIAESSRLKIEHSGMSNFGQSSLANFGESGLHHFVQSIRPKLSPLTARSNSTRPTFTAYSLFINPLILIDVKFLIAVGCVILVAVLEKKLAENGIIAPAALIAGIIKIGFPVAAFVSILILISKLGVFL